MPLSITCSCGARLEIDDRFAGQVIPCPDCQAPLQLPAPEPTRHPRVSGLAVTSLLVALVGAFTLVGGLAAVLLGFVARRRIESQPARLTGLRYAGAAMIVGATGALLTIFALVAPEVGHLDALLREFEWAGRLDYTAMPRVTKSIGVFGEISLIIPSKRWGVCQASTTNGADHSDNLILVDVWDDAQIACQTVELSGDERDWEAARGKGLERFQKSELVNLVGRLRGKALAKEATPRDVKTLDDGAQEMFVDLRLGGLERTFVLRMSKKDSRLYVLVGGARKHRFGRLEAQFRTAFESFKVAQ